MKRILQVYCLAVLVVGLVSCSSSQVDTGEVKGAAVETGGEFHLNQKNPFEWSSEDVQRGSGGTYEGGKRSQFDAKGESSYAKSRKAPGYFSRDFQSAAWNGNKNYSTGSYDAGKKTSTAGNKSWFGWKKNKDANKVARAAGQNFQTGGYTTAAARESGNIVASPNSAYADSQRIGAKPIIIYSQESYRQMTMDQSRSLLGRR
ncbi:MAG: hypothetical protein QNL24_04475 [Akkermansiaceae bacterium]|jgi:hypothetical protein|nr:hypothetical protein [bacterium]|tara:strand:- start:6421 stop:7029 length:609 start_codon:yes stop_codon:yes gene_type:complete